MQTRVKLYSQYRKELTSLKDIVEVKDYLPKHLISKNVTPKVIEKKVQNLNEYEEKRVIFNKIYYRKRLLYYLLVTFISLGLIALAIYLGIIVF